jgi:hypothetical protein
MQETVEGFYKNITLNDIQLAAAYYPILIDLAKNKHMLSYSDLVERAKLNYPDKEYVQNAIAVSTGRKLDVVRIFTQERNLPDVTCLIINKNKGECGTGFTDHFDPEQARKIVYLFDWRNVENDFVIYIESVEKQITPRPRISKDQAKNIMSIYYKENKNSLPLSIKKYREKIIELLMEGSQPEKVFEEIVDIYCT